MNNKISSELSKGITTLFKDPSIGLGFLGLGEKLIENGRSTVDETLPYMVRLRMLRDKLEQFIVQMAEELEELGEEEEERLRSEATSMLVIIREIETHFPEISR